MNKKNIIYALGPAGTNGHEAAEIARQRLMLQYGDLSIKFCERNGDIPIAVRKDRCLGIVPIENSTEGLVGEIVKGFWLNQKDDDPGRVRVIGEISLEIHHQLLVQDHVTHISDIQSVCSHPQALGQCARTLNRLGINTREPHRSTAGAAKDLSEELDGLHTAAIASRFAAKTYGLKVIKKDIEDVKGNTTRFHILGLRPRGSVLHDRTAVIFRVADHPGSLIDALEPIRNLGVNMSSIHSIPLGLPQQYGFYCEFDAHAGHHVGMRIINEMRKATAELILLGSYPRSIR